jgi:RES domain-containing protein
VPDQSLGEFEVDIHAGLDLTNADILKALGIKIEDIAHSSDHYITKMIGAAAWALGVEALVVPSSVDPAMRNIVIFRDHLQPPSQVERKKITRFTLPGER